MTQLHANSINPHTEPLPFWVSFMPPEIFFSKPNLPSTKKIKKKKIKKKSVGTLCEKLLFLHPTLKINTGAKTPSNLPSTQQKIRLYTEIKSLFLAVLPPSSSVTSSLYCLKFTLQ